MYNKHKIYEQRAKNLQNKTSEKVLKKKRKYLTINKIKLYPCIETEFKLQFFLK